jgi:hypothetical protein
MRGDVFIDSETMIDIVNLKIRSNESFKDAHKNKIYTHIFIEMNIHFYKYHCAVRDMLRKTEAVSPACFCTVPLIN